MGGSGQDSNSIAPEMNDSGQLCQKIATNANDTKNEIDNSEGDFSSRTRGILAMTAVTTSTLLKKWQNLREVRDSSSCDPQYLEKKSADNKMAMEKDALESTTFSQNEVETEIKSYKSPPTDVDALKKKYETDFQEVCTKMAVFLNSQSVLVSEIDLFEDIKPVLTTICGLKEHDDMTTGNLLKLFQDILSKIKEAPFDAARNYEDITNGIKEGPESIEGFRELKMQQKENDYGALQETEKQLSETIMSTCNNTKRICWGCVLKLSRDDNISDDDLTKMYMNEELPKKCDKHIKTCSKLVDKIEKKRLVETQRIEKSHSILRECSNTIKAQQDTFVHDEISKLEDQVAKLEADDKLLKFAFIGDSRVVPAGSEWKKLRKEILSDGGCYDSSLLQIRVVMSGFTGAGKSTLCNSLCRSYLASYFANENQPANRTDPNKRTIGFDTWQHEIAGAQVCFWDLAGHMEYYLAHELLFTWQHEIKLLQSVMYAPVNFIKHLPKILENYLTASLTPTELNGLYLNKYMNSAEKIKMDMDRKIAFRTQGKDVLADDAKALESKIATTDEQLKTREKELEDFIEKYDYVKNNEALKAKSIVATKKEQAMEMARNEYNSMQQMKVDVMDKTRNMPAIAGVFQ
eukprot:m.267186 g.267186  ORF g.267186 m.267186 type:complete len:633 (+) comp16244_c1_seq3:183-2081(+)